MTDTAVPAAAGRRPFVALAMFALTVRPGSCDPRWWRSEPLGSSGDARHPDVAVLAHPTNPHPRFVLVYDRPGTMGGHHIQQEYSISDDCTGKIRVSCDTDLTPNELTSENTRPRIAATVTDAGLVSWRVVFERDGRIICIHDQGRDFSAPNLCLASGGLTPPREQPLSRAGGAFEIDSRPRIAAAWAGAVWQSHAVWTRTSSSGVPSIEYAHDLTGAGVFSPAIDLSEVIGERGIVPDVAADGVGAGGQSGVSVAYVNPDTGAVRMVRSGDGGNTWEAPVTVSAVAGPATVAIDAGTGRSDAQAWTGLVWPSSASPAADIRLDAALSTSPLVRNPDFDASLLDSLVSDPPPTPGADPAVAIGPTTGVQAPFFAAWEDTSTPTRLALRAGVLDGSDPGNPRRLDRFPFDPVRVLPPDPTGAELWPVLCDWDEATGACNANSAVSVAPYRAVAMAAGGASRGLPYTFAVIYENQYGFAMLTTDGEVVGTPRILDTSTACEGLRRASIDATWERVPPCANDTYDLIVRHFLHYGCAAPCADLPNASSTGPWPVREVLGSGSAIHLTALRAGAAYHLVVIPEDAARNLAPATFDPRTGANPDAGFAPGQRAVVMTPACAPSLTASCRLVGDSCGGISDGVYTPGELARYEVDFTNSGDWDLTGLEARITPGNSRVVNPPGGQLGLAALASGATSAAIPFEVVLDASCPPAASVVLEQLRSDLLSPDGPVIYADVLCPVPAPAGCAPVCTACLAPALDPIQRLQGAKVPGSPADARFVWSSPASGASEAHLNAIGAKTDVPAPASRRPAAGIGEARCTVPAASGGCTDLGLVGDPRALLFLQAYQACGGGGAEEGPP